MSEKFTFNEFSELAHDLRIMMSQLFITKGINVVISWDGSLYATQNQEDFTWSATVKMRKFSTGGIIIKPNIKFSDINRIEGTYINSDHHTYYKYYNQFQEVFPRFLYNREMMRDEKENGVGLRFAHVFGKFRLHVKNNGEIRVANYLNNNLYDDDNRNNNLFICNVEKLKTLMPEYEILISILQEHYTTPFSRVKKRNELVENEIYRIHSQRLFLIPASAEVL